jgi:hypothetical protein
MLILSDNPIPDESRDEFGFRAHAEVLCRAVAEIGDLPLTLAILGPWGSGKTSFLNICRSLLQKQGMTTVSFGPWKYDKRDEVWHALLQTLLDELARQAENSPEPGIRERLDRVMGRLRRLSLTATWLLSRQLLTAVTPVSLTGADLADLKQAWNGDPASTAPVADYHAANRFEQDFAEVVRDLTGDAPVAIFIDDLDRCRPQTALSVLEALRIFTGDAPCLFIIAMDHGALIDAAARHFNGDQVRGRRYLEKLVHFSYHLPGVRWESLGNALRSRLEFLPDDPVIWEVIRIGFQNNPRRVRRFVGMYNLTLALLSAAGSQSAERIRQVAILLMLRQEHPSFFARLQADPGIWQRRTDTGRPSGGKDHLYFRENWHLAERDPELVTILDRISDRSQFDFPPPPSADLVLILSEVVVTTELTPEDQL